MNAQKDALRTKLEYILWDNDVDIKNHPGLIIGIIDGDSTYIHSFGTAEKGKQKPIDQHDLFEIGGLTKIFTANLLAILQDEQQINFDTSANVYAKKSLLNLDGNIKVKHLMSHLSGLPRLPSNFGQREVVGDPYSAYSKKDISSFLNNSTWSKPAKERYLHSHLGYAMLNIVLEEISQTDYFDLLETKILQPFGLNETVLNVNDKALTLTPGYSHSGMMVSPWSFNSSTVFAGSLGLKSSLHDLIIFLRLQISDSRLHSLREVQLAAHRGEVMSVGLGWMIFEPRRKHYKTYAHTGNTDGHCSYIGFLPETQTGVILLSNSEVPIQGVVTDIMEAINYNWKRKE